MGIGLGWTDKNFRSCSASELAWSTSGCFYRGMHNSIAAAVGIISRLPMVRRAWSFYDSPDIGAKSDRTKWSDAGEKLLALIPGQAQREAVTLGMWASDAFVGAGQFDRAIETLGQNPMGARASLQTSNRLALRLEVGDDVTAGDVVSLFGPKVTKFGRENLDAIALHIGVQLDQRRKQGSGRLVEQWAADAYEFEGGYSLFLGLHPLRIIKPPRGLSFALSPSAETFCVAAIRAAENAWRGERKIPHVGEGWIAETRLFYELKVALDHHEVLHHASPPWLGRQHLDIYIPDLHTAIEYQGEQHDRAVEFFGGISAFELTKERDARKARLCDNNGIRLLYARAGYKLNELLSDIFNQ